MFELIQQDSLLFGSAAAIQKLARKESAKILVLSDSHGSAGTIYAILKRVGGQCDACCFCGDGGRDLVYTLANSLRDADFAKCIPPVVVCVQGNGDLPAVCIQAANEQLTFSIPQTQLFVVAGKTALVTHGHLYDVYYGINELYHAAKREKAGMVFFGHTHIPTVKNDKDILVLNPGSCARPRRGSPNSFAVVTVTPHSAAYQFYSLSAEGRAASFSEYTPPEEEISLLWQ